MTEIMLESFMGFLRYFNLSFLYVILFVPIILIVVTGLVARYMKLEKLAIFSDQLLHFLWSFPVPFSIFGSSIFIILSLDNTCYNGEDCCECFIKSFLWVLEYSISGFAFALIVQILAMALLFRRDTLKKLFWSRYTITISLMIFLVILNLVFFISILHISCTDIF